MRRSTFGVCLLALGNFACSGAADVPTTPDLRALLSGYERPTAQLDVTSVTDAFNQAPPIKVLAGGFQSIEYVLAALDDASGSAEAHSGSRVRLRGGLDIEARCPGEQADAHYDASVNGSVSLTAAVSDNRIGRTLGGSADACVLRGIILGEPTRVQLDGPLALDLGRDLGVGQRWSGQLLVSLKGTLEIGSVTFQDVSGLLTTDSFQTLVHLPDGSTILLELTGDSVTIRDGAGTWICTEDQTCVKQ